MRLAPFILVGLVGASAAFADEAVRTGAAAVGDWRTDAPGVRRLITPADLPPPFATLSAANMSQRAVRTEADVPKAPPGFAVDLFASGLNFPRVIRVAPNGDIFVAESGAGNVRVFRPDESGASPTQGEIFAEGLQRPYGIAFYPSGPDPRFVYVATPDSVVRFPYRSGEMKASGPPENIASLPDEGGHWTRDLAFSPDDKTLFVSVGSGSNVAEGALRPDETEIAEAPLSPLSAKSEAAPACSLSTRRAGTSVSTRPAFAIVPALLFSPESARSGASSTSATGSATTCRQTMRRMSPRARSMAGPGTISATIRTRATRTSAPISRTASPRPML
jgi:glucose/arabinose dehydrogenase